jgi:aminopeptidase YwaD
MNRFAGCPGSGHDPDMMYRTTAAIAGRLIILLPILLLAATLRAGPRSRAGEPGLAEATTARGAPALEEEAWLTVVRRLCAPDLAGRGLGEPGLERAAVYLAAALEEAGLEPLFDGAYLQPFTRRLSSPWRAGAALRLGPRELEPGRDFVPLAFSEAGEVEAELVFVGYGLRLPSAGYDDYEGLDVRGKVVLALRHEPRQFSDDAAFLGPRPLRAADPRVKALTARERGARALILVNDPRYAQAFPAEDRPFHARERAASAGILAAHLPWKVAERELGAIGVDLAALQRQIDAKGRPASRALGVQARAMIELSHREARLYNVGGLLPGDPARPWTLLGGHYDHLGRAEGDAGYYPGADDNASGVAGVVLLARALAAAPPRGRGPIAYVLFTGEE